MDPTALYPSPGLCSGKDVGGGRGLSGGLVDLGSKS